MNEKKYNALDSALQDVTGSAIRLSKTDKKRYKEHFGKVLECIIKEMKKKNEVFNFLYRSNVYTGSSYENLRISKPDEFDINLIFVLPATCKIDYDKKQPGFVKIKVKSLDESQIKKHQSDVPSLERVLNTWIDKKSGYIQRTEFMQWMQGVFTKALDDVSLHKTLIKRSASGPAFTLKVSLLQSELTEYSVDLVPVFEFPDNDWPPLPVRKLHKRAVNKEWTVVPKPPPGVSDPFYWRMSFYKQEREIMNNSYGMKHVIKLIKLFRDKEKWKVLSSYAIKTVFLWEHEQQSKEDFWQNGVGQLFVHMLQRLSEVFAKQTIPFYWDRNLNLLSKVKEDTMKIMNNRINNVLTKIESQLEDKPEFIKTFFCSSSLEEIHDDNSKSNPNNSMFKEQIIQQQSIVESTNRKSPRFATKHQNQSLFLEIPGIEKSSIIITRNLEGCDRCAFKAEENNNAATQYTFGCIGDHIHQTNKIPDSLVSVLQSVLKEQHEIKQILQSLTQRCAKLENEVKALREETSGGKLLQKEYSGSSSQSSVSFHNLIDIEPSSNTTGPLSASQVFLNEQKCSVAPNTQGENIPLEVTNTSKSHISDLIDVFTA